MRFSTCMDAEGRVSDSARRSLVSARRDTGELPIADEFRRLTNLTQHASPTYCGFGGVCGVWLVLAGVVVAGFFLVTVFFLTLCSGFFSG